VYSFAEQCDSDITDSRATSVSKKVLEGENTMMGESLLTFQNVLSPVCSSASPSKAESNNTYKNA
jgi:hypothetical protein